MHYHIFKGNFFARSQPPTLNLAHLLASPFSTDDNNDRIANEIPIVHFPRE